MNPDQLNQLAKHFVDKQDRIEDFLAYHRNQVVCPVYTSIDIRHNAHKMAVVDTNAFPAGFNNLSQASHMDASQAIQGYTSRMYPGAKSVLLVAENHTRNTWYFQSLYTLRKLFVNAGYEVTVGTLMEELWPKSTVQTALGNELELHAVTREGDSLVAGGDIQDVVVLNNDLSGGSPAVLDGLDQPVTPPASMGWHRRSKSEHFRITNELVQGLAKHASFDPWLLSAEYELVQDVDFKGRAGMDRVADAADEVLARVQAKFDAYGIDREPNVFVKADRGTYGMGIMTAKSGDDLRSINSKQREKMDRGKDKQKTASVIVQEGVFTDVRSGEGVAEPVMYMVCGRVVGGFNRVHSGKGDQDNLNSPGSMFQPLNFPHQVGAESEHLLPEDRARAYQLIGEVASIATGYEWKSYQQGGLEVPLYA